MKKPSNLTIILLMALMMLVLLACNMPTNSRNKSTPVVASTVEATAAASIWENNFENAPAGKLSLTFTESQLTSALDQFLKAQPTKVMSEPQLLLRDGKMDLYGKVTQGPITTDLHLNMEAVIGASGKPEVNIVSGELGPVPLPDALRSSLDSVIDSAIEALLKEDRFGFTIESIVIGDGLLTISGTKH